MSEGSEVRAIKVALKLVGHKDPRCGTCDCCSHSDFTCWNFKKRILLEDVCEKYRPAIVIMVDKLANPVVS